MNVMNVLNLLFAFLAVSHAIYCEDVGPRVNGGCDQIITTPNCYNFYHFSYNTTTAKIILAPRSCQYGSVATACEASNAPCIPSCKLLKTGGPSGKFCSDLTTRSSCAKYYCDEDGGDRWCEWINNQCVGTQICHD